MEINSMQDGTTLNNTIQQGTKVEDTYKRVSSRVETDWYPYHKEEWFSQLDIYSFFEWRESETRKLVSRKLFHDSTERKPPLLEKKGKVYRIIDDDAEEMDWQNADSTKVIDIILPFGISEYVKFFPKTIIVVAGEPNAGKTAFLYNVILDNMSRHIITLYNSETSSEQMKDRLSHFDTEIPNPAPFITKERYENFADIINPDGFSVIDYIDADNEFWSIGAEISRIYKKLNKGIVVCAIQKKENYKNFKGQEIRNTTGYGGSLTKKRPALYLTMTSSIPHKLTIEKAKTWAYLTVNPNGMQWTYKLVGGAKFVNIERVGEEEE